ncbi:MAG: preprotein translocase subunit SecG [Bacteroidetes bacterium MedPE-SWsnd-G1]|uniref:Protein-export membrane protein SecG n=1 Tax=Urechidicola vernalis TaxID=3075600 RepID=A0ABU2Y4Z9_9FLAO|nr:preprotein translocase subunit SecG [Urechidicola sp. P050]MDT0553269.1 preprotein translocase subunit SecG [Urechidicola sp. P050]OIQ38126.1 MAG: preprotein translocase subunit SecG [Bacteroidetes bacterium MedPE-SWsnd-G1]
MSYSLFLVLIMIVAVLLVLIIMVQNPKGGGLSSSFGGSGSQSVGGGVQNTTNFLDKSTWTLSIVLLLLILVSNFASPNLNSAPTDTTIQNTLDQRDAQEVPAEPAATTPTDTVQ